MVAVPLVPSFSSCSDLSGMVDKVPAMASTERSDGLSPFSNSRGVPISEYGASEGLVRVNGWALRTSTRLFLQPQVLLMWARQSMIRRMMRINPRTMGVAVSRAKPL